MSLSFAYTRQRVTTPAIALGGAMARPRPLVDVTLIGPGNTTAFAQGVLDTGADDTVLHEVTASTLGIDLSACPSSLVRVAGGATLLVRYASVTFRLSDGVEQLEWTALVGFAALRGNALLGFAGFLRYFKVTFDNEMEVVELEKNRLYPGT